MKQLWNFKLDFIRKNPILSSYISFVKGVIITLILCSLLSSCKIYTYPPQPEISHVLAVTKQGDTINVPIDQFKKNISPDYYNGYQFYWNNSWLYYNDWYYNHFYRLQRPYIQFRQPRIKTPKYQQPRNYSPPRPPQNRGRSNQQPRVTPRQQVRSSQPTRTQTTPNVIRRSVKSPIRNKGNQ